jgi:hypothetical protein
MIEIPLWLVALVGLLLVAGSLAVMSLQRKKRPSSPPLPKEWALTARSVFTTGERRVYRMLKETLPNHVILSKLPLVRFCQPIDLSQLRYWYDMLGTNYVSFAICAPNGRVLAAIDIDKDRSTDANAHLRRSMKIKRSVLRSCRVRYLRTPAGKLPSAAEIHALLPKSTPATEAAANAAAADALQPANSTLATAKAAAAQSAAMQAAAQLAAEYTAQAQAGAAPLEATEPPTLTASPDDIPSLQVDEEETETDAETSTDTHTRAQPQPELDTAPSFISPPPPRAARASPSGFAASSQFGDSRSPEAEAAAEARAADKEALSRAREALASTVASRRAQRNIMWQESNVFQDSFFALDSRLDDDVTVSGGLEAHADSPSPAPLPPMPGLDEIDLDLPPIAQAGAGEPAKPDVVKLTLEDMVPSKRLSKSVPADVEEARYASS